MHDLTVARVNSHMTGITDDITGLCVFQTIHRRTHTSVCRRRMGQVYAKVLVHAHNKPGTVCTIVRLVPPYT